jgi:hypothetical protein
MCLFIRYYPCLGIGYVLIFLVALFIWANESKRGKGEISLGVRFGVIALILWSVFFYNLHSQPTSVNQDVPKHHKFS